MNRLFSVLVLLLSLVSVPAVAQQKAFTDPLVDRLVGKWILRGVIAGKPVVHDISAQWTLAHQYLEIHEVSRETNVDGTPAYQATVFIGWDQSKGIYDCVWLDDYGSISTQSLGYATPAENRLAFVFKDRDDPDSFHTTFTYDAAAERWTMNMDQTAGEKMTPFARTTLTRS